MGNLQNKQMGNLHNHLDGDLFDAIRQQRISIALENLLLSYKCDSYRVANVTPCKTKYFEAKRLE